MRTGVATAKSDVYSMGLVIYEMVTGAHPISPREASVMTICQRQLTFVPPPLATLGRDLPGDLSEIIERAIAKDPAPRPTMRELADRLAVVLSRLLVQRRAAARSLPLPMRSSRGTMARDASSVWSL